MTRRIALAVAGLLMASGLARGEASVSDTDAKQAGANKNPPEKKCVELRIIDKEWELIWSVDQPSRLPPDRLRRVKKPGHLAPERVHGGIQ